MSEESNDPNLKKKADHLPQNYFKESKKKISPKKITPFLESEKPTGNFYKDMESFFKQLGRSYEGRYSLWENTFTSIVAILRKMRQLNEDNTKSIIDGLNQLENQITKNFEEFRIKRDEVERFSDVDLKGVIGNFKKTLEVLKLKVQEYRVQHEINELFDIYSK
ncbi:MAG: hypothetical protein ACTSVL_12390 [Promethearchaeota archaeon]